MFSVKILDTFLFHDAKSRFLVEIPHIVNIVSLGTCLGQTSLKNLLSLINGY